MKVALNVGRHSPRDRESGSSWDREQASVALRTAEAKYIAVSVASRKVEWLWKLLTWLFDQMLKSIMTHSDHESYVKISVNLVFHDKSKQVEIKYVYIQDMVQRRAIKL